MSSDVGPTDRFRDDKKAEKPGKIHMLNNRVSFFSYLSYWGLRSDENHSGSQDQKE